MVYKVCKVYKVYKVLEPDGRFVYSSSATDRLCPKDSPDLKDLIDLQPYRPEPKVLLYELYEIYKPYKLKTSGSTSYSSTVPVSEEKLTPMRYNRRGSFR